MKIPSIVANYILFEVYDYDRFLSDDFIGYAELNIQDAIMGEEMTIPVYNSDGFDSSLAFTINYSDENIDKATKCFKKTEKMVCYIESEKKEEKSEFSLNKPFFRVKLFNQDEEIPLDPIIQLYDIIATRSSLTYAYLINVEKMESFIVKFYLENIVKGIQRNIVIASLPSSSATEKTKNIDIAYDLKHKSAKPPLCKEIIPIEDVCEFSLYSSSCSIIKCQERYSAPLTKIQSDIFRFKNEPVKQEKKISEMYDDLGHAVSKYECDPNPISEGIDKMLIVNVCKEFIQLIADQGLEEKYQKQITAINKKIKTII